MCLCQCMAHVQKVLERQEESFGYPVAAVSDYCEEEPGVGTET